MLRRRTVQHLECGGSGQVGGGVWDTITVLSRCRVRTQIRHQKQVVTLCF
jgi:hypothetical protein